MDQPLVKRLWVLKVYRDVVADGRGTSPVDPDDILTARASSDFRPKDIGYLTKPVRIDEWIATVWQRVQAVGHLVGSFHLDDAERGIPP